jgi:hypothetical protein
LAAQKHRWLSGSIREKRPRPRAVASFTFQLVVRAEWLTGSVISRRQRYPLRLCALGALGPGCRQFLPAGIVRRELVTRQEAVDNTCIQQTGWRACGSPRDLGAWLQSLLLSLRWWPAADADVTQLVRRNQASPQEERAGSWNAHCLKACGFGRLCGAAEPCATWKAGRYKDAMTHGGLGSFHILSQSGFQACGVSTAPPLRRASRHPCSRASSGRTRGLTLARPCMHSRPQGDDRSVESLVRQSAYEQRGLALRVRVPVASVACDVIGSLRSLV